jgi:hypothetical protein
LIRIKRKQPEKLRWKGELLREVAKKLGPAPAVNLQLQINKVTLSCVTRERRLRPNDVRGASVYVMLADRRDGCRLWALVSDRL